MLEKRSPTRPLRWVVALSFCFWSAVFGAEPSPPARIADHVVLLVWDGMRPDFITPRLTPNLWHLRTNGVFFNNNHCVFVTSTEVNGTALATGLQPENSGIIANKMYLPHLNILEPVATESVDTIRRSDDSTRGHYLGGLTIAEAVQQAGLRTAVAGAKDVAFLHDRSHDRASEAARDSKVLHAGRTIPAATLATLRSNLGKAFPAYGIPNKARDEWTTKALTETFWKEGVPAFSVLWLSEPDASQHDTAPGSSNALVGVSSSDRNLGVVLAELQKKGVRDKTDIFVVSDHAFSTVEAGPDVCEALRKAGFDATRKFDDPEPGQILVVGLGGAVMFYVVEHDVSIVQRLVEFLQKSDFAGVIFTKTKLPGTFSLAEGRVEIGTNAPDVVLSMRWSARTNAFGVPGLLTADGTKKGTGTHSSLSRFDLHNTLVAGGPHLRRGFIDELPSGNIDVAPTILWLLGIQGGRRDGRILREALTEETAGVLPAHQSPPQTEVLEATANLKHKQWRQYLKVTTFEGSVYLDEGNAEHR